MSITQSDWHQHVSLTTVVSR